MTEHVKVLNDLELHGALIMPDDNADFPLNPALGTFVIKDRCLYGYLKIGGMETWYPFASKTNSFIHTQGVPALTWTVTHNLGTSNVWIQVKNEQGNIVGVGKTDVSDNQFQLNFTSAIKGTVVVVAPDSVDVPVVKASLIQVGANVEINTTGVLINGQYALTAANISAEIQAAIDAVVAGAPGALDTLNELAAALGNDANYAATIVNALASKADIVAVDAQIAVVSAEATLAASTLQTDLAALTNTVSDKADLSYVTAQLSTQQAALSGVYTSTEVDAALALKADTSSLATVATSGSYADLSGKPTSVSAFTNDSGYQTSADVATAITAATPTFSSLTGKPTTLSGYGITDAYTKTVVDTALAGKASASSLATVATSGSYTDLSNKPTIPTVPTAVSSFTNDSGYQTAANVTSAIQAVVGAAPAALDTLAEIATQLASDESAAAALVTTVSGKANTATTLSGYGITDAYTKTAVDTALAGKANTATTLSGYGIVLTSANVTTALGFTPYNTTTALSGGTF